MSKRKKNLEKVIQQCQKTLDKIDEELAKPEPKLTPYDIEMRNFDEVPRAILKIAKEEIKIMMQILDKNEQMPDYTYPLIDSYSFDTELCHLLFETKSIYKKYTQNKMIFFPRLFKSELLYLDKISLKW